MSELGGTGSRFEFSNVTRHCLLHTLSELAPNGIHAVLPASGSHKVKSFCDDLAEFARRASLAGKKRGGGSEVALSLPAPPLLTELEVHKFFEGAVSVLDFARQLEQRLVALLPVDFDPEVMHTICWRYYGAEKKGEIAYPKWLSPTCTYRLWLIFNCVLGQSINLDLPAVTLNEVLRRMVELCGYTWNETYQFQVHKDASFPQCIEAITNYFDKLELETSLTCEVIADMVDEVVHGVLRKSYLMKKGHKRKNWNKRWFILQRTILRYYKSREKLEQKGQLVLNGSTEVRSLPDKVSKGYLCRFLVTCGRTGVPFEMRAEDQRTKHEWMLAIKKAIALAQIIEGGRKHEDFSKSISGFYLLKYGTPDPLLSRQDSEIKQTKYYTTSRSYQRIRMATKAGDIRDSGQGSFSSADYDEPPLDEYIPITSEANYSSNGSSDEDENGYFKMYPAGSASIAYESAASSPARDSSDDSIKTSKSCDALSVLSQDPPPTSPLHVRQTSQPTISPDQEDRDEGGVLMYSLCVGATARYVPDSNGTYIDHPSMPRADGNIYIDHARRSHADSGHGSADPSSPPLTTEEDHEVAAITKRNLALPEPSRANRSPSPNASHYLTLLHSDPELLSLPPVPPLRQGTSVIRSPITSPVHSHEVVRRSATSSNVELRPLSRDPEEAPPPPPHRTGKRIASASAVDLPPPPPARSSTLFTHSRKLSDDVFVEKRQTRLETIADIPPPIPPR